MRSCLTVHFNKYYYGYQIMEDEMGGHVARMGELIERHTKLWSENLKGRDQCEDLGIDGRIILESIFRKLGRKAWTGCIWLRKRANGGLL
jgi:hypothetical protein